MQVNRCPYRSLAGVKAPGPGMILCRYLRPLLDGRDEFWPIESVSAAMMAYGSFSIHRVVQLT
eukprot:scaffold3246_cov69-Cylindrotheca_fusiformis.AAC.2